MELFLRKIYGNIPEWSSNASKYNGNMSKWSYYGTNGNMFKGAITTQLNTTLMCLSGAFQQLAKHTSNTHRPSGAISQINIL